MQCILLLLLYPPNHYLLLYFCHHFITTNQQHHTNFLLSIVYTKSPRQQFCIVSYHLTQYHFLLPVCILFLSLCVAGLFYFVCTPGHWIDRTRRRLRETDRKSIIFPLRICCWSCSPPAAEYALARLCQFWQPTFPCWLRASIVRGTTTRRLPYWANGLVYPSWNRLYRFIAYR